MAAAEQSTRPTGRPSFPDDMIVRVVLRPHTFAMLIEGMEVEHVRLDLANVDDGGDVYAVYVETRNEIPAIPAPDAPHSPTFGRRNR
jgi:hypothetical protein